MAGLEEDYDRLKRLIEIQLVQCKTAVQTALSKEQYEEWTEGVEELSENFMQLRELRTNLEKMLPWDTDKLQGHLDIFYNKTIPELEELRRYFNLESAFETGSEGLSSRPGTEAEREKFSETEEVKLFTAGLTEEFSEKEEVQLATVVSKR